MSSPEPPAIPVLDAAARRQAAEEDTDLREGLAGLSRLALDHHGLAAMLTHVAEFAARAIRAADGAGLTLLYGDCPATVVASAEFVRQVDAIQYRIGEGPCITVATQGHTVSSGSLGGEKLWPRFGPRVGRLGVHSVVSLPLLGSDPAVLGALNIYAYAKDAFDERAIELGELFAVPAAVAVQAAKELDTARRLAAQLESALTSRQIIDHAIGIVMSRTGCSSEEAFDKLRVISQTEHRKLAQVAQQVRDDAVRRARARYAAG
ncbi:MAG: hypothetical protein QOH60_5121 [Mycobacterium sp.]|jgi:GAF domain-containing protein|nr:hypothetical protein [Mycobacterium sp.]